jgi:uncharacterized membrane protein YhaH (DUF805 family)
MKELFGFSGRIGRRQYWTGQIFTTSLWAIGLIYAGEAAMGTRSELYWIVMAGSAVLAVWINLSSTIQRYHDRGKSGFWLFIILVPLVGFVILFVELAFFPAQTVRTATAHRRARRASGTMRVRQRATLNLAMPTR